MSVTRKRLALLCSLLVITLAAGGLWGFSQTPPEPQYVPGKVLVKFGEDVSEERIKIIVGRENGRVASVLKSTGVYIVELPANADVPEAVLRFLAYPEVIYAEPDYRATPLEEK